jgi:hypothetical protein
VMNRPAAGAGPNAGPEVRLRTMRILWAVFLVTIGLFVLMSRLVRTDPRVGAETARDNPTLLYVLAAAALTSVIASFALKAGFYRRAAEQQQPAQMQTGFILALVLCEAAALMGYVGVLVTWNNYAYLLFALGALGEILHFPSRDQLLSAYPRSVM